jgi:uncharacterized glyoxalase superfamily protein PhnB
MKPTPAGWPRISTAVSYERAGEAIDWLCNAFGFEVRLKVEGDDGAIHHSELVYGDGVIMISDQKAQYPWRKPPSQLGGVNTQSMMVYVDDVEAHAKRARAAGATIVTEPETHDYGADHWSDRIYECVDLAGHHWWFSQRLRTP